jgi:hypothetical protein
MMVALSCGEMTLVPLSTTKGQVKRVEVTQLTDVSALLG